MSPVISGDDKRPASDWNHDATSNKDHLARRVREIRRV